MTALKTVALLSVILLFSCGGNQQDSKNKESGSVAKSSDSEILAAGATFPYPLYSKMFDVYHKQTGIKINYQSIGSGGGIKQLESQTIDFGASDAYLSDDKIESMPREVLHIPMVLGAVVLSYNLPGITGVKLTPALIAEIFMGKITNWNDPALAEVNEGIELPDLKIIVVQRSDGSGTTFIFTDYLSKISPEWKEQVGHGKSVKWPAGLGAKGNEGVSGMIKQMKGAIGYCELAYAMQNKMPSAMIQNASGKFITPEISSISAAAITDIPEDTRVSLTNTEAEEGYPISSFTWVLIYKEQNYNNNTPTKAKNIVELLWWMTHNGQKFAEPLDYAPLPQAAVEKAEAQLKKITFDGNQIWQ